MSSTKKLILGQKKFLIAITLLITMPVQAELDLVKLLELVRNSKLSEVRTHIAENGDIGKEYLRNHAQIFLPAVARIGTVNELNLFVDILGTDHLQLALDDALVAAFDNLKFGPLIEPLLSFGANPSARALGHTAIGRAAFAHARRNEAAGLDAVDLLLKRGANPNVAEDSGMTPLMWACSSDDEPLIKLLLASGANPEAKTKEGRTLAMVAGAACHQLIPSIAQTAASIPFADELMLQALYQAIITNDIAQCTELLNQGVSANAILDDTGQNFLMKAKNSEVMRRLLQHGANPNWTDVKGWTVLQHLVTCPHTAELVKILLEAKIEVQSRIENGQDALLLTHLLFVEKLDAANGKEILQALVQAGANINNADRDGETLLHLAAYNNAGDLAQIALELGADPYLPNQRGETPLRLAKRLQANEVLEILNQHIMSTSQPSK